MLEKPTVYFNLSQKVLSQYVSIYRENIHVFGIAGDMSL